MAKIRIDASLPFPLRVSSAPYLIETSSTTWEIIVERVQRQHPDERILDAGSTVDFIVDREGQAAYSKISGSAEIPDVSTPPVDEFLEAVNLLIEHVRDLFDVHWIRALETVDLLQLTVRIDWEAQATWGFGRAEGVQVATVGLQPQADERLKAAVQTGRRPPIWRTIQLDALEASKLGRYEDACVLAWTAIESACRSTLPGLAYASGLSVAELDERLEVRNRSNRPSLSHEESVERAPFVLRVLVTTADLDQSNPYDARSLAESVRLALRLRNRVVHQGIRMSYEHADDALQAIDFFLGSLSLRSIDPPPPDFSWQARFGPLGARGQALLDSGPYRLVVANPPERGGFITSWWDPERLAGDLWVRADHGMPGPVAEVLLVATCESWSNKRQISRPRLRISRDAQDFQIAGLLRSEVGAVEESLSVAEALIRRQGEDGVAEAAEHALDRMVEELVSAALTFSPDDVRSVTLAARLASYAAALAAGQADTILSKLQDIDQPLAERSTRWAEAMRKVDAQNLHSICGVLRAIHDSAPMPWLDSILVDCPIEELSFGSAQRPLGQPD